MGCMTGYHLCTSYLPFKGKNILACAAQAFSQGSHNKLDLVIPREEIWVADVHSIPFCSFYIVPTGMDYLLIIRYTLVW